MKLIDRLINAYIQGSYLRLDGKTAGVKGESRMKTLRLHLSPEWLELTKKVLFMDAKGQNPVSILLSSEVSSYVAGTELVFDVPIPGEALAEEGECTFIVSGTAEDKQGYSVQGNLKVLPNDFYGVEPGNASTPTPTEMEQLQGYMDDILQQAGEVAKDTVQEAKNAQAAAEAAAAAADADMRSTHALWQDTQRAKGEAIAHAQYADEARQAAEAAKTAAENAKAAAESAKVAAESAESGAESARKAAETAAAAAQAKAEESARQADAADKAATRAENALQTVQTNASNAQTAEREAKSAASEAVTAKLAAQSAANSAADYASAAAAAANAAQAAQSGAEAAANRAEGYTSHPPIPTEDGRFWRLWDGSKYVTTEYRAEGEDGISPKVSVVKKDYGYEVTITDLNGAETFTIWNGEDGEPGASGGINNLWYVDRIGKELAGEVASVVSDLQGGDDTTWAGRTPAAGDMVIARKDGMLLTISSIFSKDLFGTEEDLVGYDLGNGYIEGYPAKVTVGFTDEYDFVCDGVDDQETINLAISALPDHGGTVIIGPGTYHLTGRIHSNAWKSDDTRRRQRILLKGQQIGGNVSTGSETEVILQRDYTTHAGASGFNGLVAMNAEEICLENITLYGKSQFGHAIGPYATGNMPMDGSTMFSRLDVKNCKISDFYYGVNTDETFMGTKRRSSVRIENSRIENCDYGARVFSYLEVENCRVAGCGIGVLMVSGNDTTNSKVVGNVFLDNDAAVRVGSDNATVSGNFVSRGTGQASDFTAEQHTIMLGAPTTSTNPKGIYPKNAWVCGNKLVGKGVSYAGDPVNDGSAANLESCRVLGNE